MEVKFSRSTSTCDTMQCNLRFSHSDNQNGFEIVWLSELAILRANEWTLLYEHDHCGVANNAIHCILLGCVLTRKLAWDNLNLYRI